MPRHRRDRGEERESGGGNGEGQYLGARACRLQDDRDDVTTVFAAVGDIFDFLSCAQTRHARRHSQWVLELS